MPYALCLRGMPLHDCASAFIILLFIIDLLFFFSGHCDEAEIIIIRNKSLKFTVFAVDGSK